MAKMACAQCGGTKKMQVGGRSIPFPIIPVSEGPRRYRTSMEEGEDGVWRSKFSDYSEPTKSTKKTLNRVKRQRAVNKVKKTVRKIGKALSPNYQDGGMIPKSYSDNINSKKHVRQLMKADKKMDKADKKWDKKDVKQQAKELMKSKRFQKGGMTSKVLGPPKQPFAAGIPYFTGAGQTGPEYMQKGGSFAPNRAVQASCKGGMVRDENGRCVMQRKMQMGGSAAAVRAAKAQMEESKAEKRHVTQQQAQMRVMYGSGKSAGKSKTTMSGGTKYKNVNYGPLAPGAKGSVSKTKTDSEGKLIKTSTKSISQNRANRMINRMSEKAQMGGTTKAKKFAALAPPYNKATAADRIAGAKKNARKK